MPDEEYIVKKYHQRHPKQVFIGYYRGYPLSYFPNEEGVHGYEFIFVGPLPDGDTYETFVLKTNDHEQMKKRITECIRDFEGYIDKYLTKIEQQQKEDLHDEKFILTVAREKVYIDPEPEPKVELPKKVSWVNRLLCRGV